MLRILCVLDFRSIPHEMIIVSLSPPSALPFKHKRIAKAIGSIIATSAAPISNAPNPFLHPPTLSSSPTPPAHPGGLLVLGLRVLGRANGVGRQRVSMRD